MWTFHPADGSGKMWIGTLYGLDLLDPASGKSRGVIPKKMVYRITTLLCILEDAAGKLSGSSTNDGLIRIDPREDTSFKITSEDGWQSNEFNSGACARTREGSWSSEASMGSMRFVPKRSRTTRYRRRWRLPGSACSTGRSRSILPARSRSSCHTTRTSSALTLRRWIFTGLRRIGMHTSWKGSTRTGWMPAPALRQLYQPTCRPIRFSCQGLQ